MTGSVQSPVSRLVLFMVCLSVAGAFIAGLHYYAVDLPAQNAVQAPENTLSDDCKRLYATCRQSCGQRVEDEEHVAIHTSMECVNACYGIRDACSGWTAP